MPSGAVTLDRRGLALHVCDPGKSAAAPPNSADDALGFAADRAFVESEMVRGGIPPLITRCMADHMVARPDYQQFVDTAMSDTAPKGAAEKKFEATIGELAGSCGA